MRRRSLDRIIDECINREVMNSRRYSNNYGYIDEGFMDTRMGKAMGRGISKAGMGIGNRLSKWGNSLSNVASNYGRRFANTGSNGGNQTGNQPSYQENPLPTGNNNTNYNDPDDDDEEEMTNQTNSDNGANYDEEDTDNNQAGSDNASNYDEGDDDNTQAGSNDYGQPQGNSDDDSNYDEDEYDNGGFGEGRISQMASAGPQLSQNQRKYQGMIGRVEKNIPIMDTDITDLTKDGYINRNIGNYAIKGLNKVEQNLELANKRNMGLERRQRALAQKRPNVMDDDYNGFFFKQAEANARAEKREAARRAKELRQRQLQGDGDWD